MLKIFILLSGLFVWTSNLFSASYEACATTNKKLVTCKYTTQQSWDQGDGSGTQTRDREAFVYSSGESSGKLPLLFVFHGNGGNGKDMLSYMKNKFSSDFLSQFIIISPSGYEKSWNIVAEKF